MPRHSLQELAELLNGELRGGPEILIDRVQPPEDAGEGDIAVVIAPRYAQIAEQSAASAIVASRDLEVVASNVIVVRDPRRALAQLLRRFYPEHRPQAGVEDGAWVHEDARVGEGVYVAAGARVEARAVLGDRVEIHANAVVGKAARVGAETVLYPNVTVYTDTEIGSRVSIHAGSVIGSPGFSQLRGDGGRCEGFPQVGRVEIGDDVEIGACCTIDRATVGATRIGRGTKIDNLVQIGHNCVIGEDCLIIAQVGISGSVSLGDGCTLAGQVGVADHVTLEPGCVVGAKSGVIRDLETGVWIGYPALPAARARRVYTQLESLPEMRVQLRKLDQRCADLERKLRELGDAAGEGSPGPSTTEPESA